MEFIRPDFRKSLPLLRSEWDGCRRCGLGEFRDASGGSFVFGEGQRGGIMFIGEGPGKDEAAYGQPFIGASGKLLRHIIKKLGITTYYITSAVCCRSCAPQYDTEGNLMQRLDYKTKQLGPIIKDQPPTPQQIAACQPRLYQEIYLVDPVLIVALGKQAAEAVARQSVSITAESGNPLTVRIPGAGYHPSVTAKRREWARNVKKQFTMPVEQNEVEYLMIPIVHPALLLSRHLDERKDNPVQLFVDGMRRAVSIYTRYRMEVFGDTIDTYDLNESDVLEAIG